MPVPDWLVLERGVLKGHACFSVCLWGCQEEDLTQPPDHTVVLLNFPGRQARGADCRVSEAEGKRMAAAWLTQEQQLSPEPPAGLEEEVGSRSQRCLAGQLSGPD